ncbi:FadD32-like long-chain-fatty-acid--AMP ligase [Corynebacterium heidelbergense]|uniref:Acyl-CoA synthase n=1 Tax=Corynebacterium heidelbergense TaxID=2055947 RepID=A0A364VCP5_9CORY|nr:FadD32-like long-chain-fatty-acid--AMP ligase [Corynebacterium heidelbergense]RAV34336.1 acyl-CoA synthase [Corynebacterium heidelbergense]WCZ35725.1 Long-chain-fatty-acid--AMP ligase FadD32 [Corynebacterium heidelbergense]
MDISAAMGQFYDEKGNIAVPDQLTLSGMCEMLYTMAQMEGTVDSPLMRYWDYSRSREGELRVYTRQEVNTRIKAVCVRLQQVAEQGERVAILANNSPEYVFAFLGAIYAKMVPVPLYDPAEPGHADHLTAVLGSARPSIVLTNQRSARAVRSFFADRPAGQRPRVILVDALPDSLAEEWVNPMMAMLADPESAPKASDIAFLQYTSGSTRTPAGVILTHRSIVTNVLQIFSCIKLVPPLRLSTWLPLHHDMGIIIAAFVTILGIPFDLMSPRDFIQDPTRWVRQLRRLYDEEHVYAVVPNFALELASRYSNPAEVAELKDLDLSGVEGLINGSEPVTRASVNRFLEVFEPYGFRRDAMRPSYGLAEASLIVTTPQTDSRPVLAWLDREELAQGTARKVEPEAEGGLPLISVGQVCAPQVMAIVDPTTGEELPDGTVGEVWARGDNMAAGYLDREEETQATFHNTLPMDKRLKEGSRAGDAPEDTWLRTGDLAVVVDGETYITGRLKDLIIVAGRNHYPQDLEATAEAATDQVARGVIAAFAVPGKNVEDLIVVAERDETADPARDEEAKTAIRAAISKTHGVQPADVRIVSTGGIPRSSAHKIARRVTAKAYTQGKFD